MNTQPSSAHPQAPWLVRFSVDHPKLIMGIVIAATIIFAAMIPMVQVDTDPENMLSEDEAVRIFHNRMKKEFTMYDMVVVGVVDEEHPDGVFTPETLKNVYDLTEFSKTLQWPNPDDPEKTEGVMVVDLLAPSTMDHIKQAGLGAVQFEWLMPEPPTTREAALAVRDNALDNPLLKGTLVSEDGQALALYLPLSKKDLSYKVYSELNKKIAEFSGTEKYYITGLPVAEDTFGVEMFIQMAISAPLAMLVIFLLMLYFFRKLNLIVSAMIVAMVSVISTMGLLIGTGYTVHIMSSMIPIFIMPIAVLDAIHILSDFFDRYQRTKDRRKTILYVMHHLFKPMLYTSLTSIAGFASLALAHIPPVQVFGVFIAIGIGIAWLLSVTFIPAFTMLIKEDSLSNFGAQETHTGEAKGLSKFVIRMGQITFRHAKLVLGIAAILTAIALYGIVHININDNPVKWFSKNHPIRVADQVLNEHFGGTYMAFLALEAEEADPDTAVRIAMEETRSALTALTADMQDEIPAMEAVANQLTPLLSAAGESTATRDEYVQALGEAISQKFDTAPDTELDAWDEVSAMVQRIGMASQTFKRPDVLNYIAGLQDAMNQTDTVGKSNSITDIVKKIHKELFESNEAYNRVPDSPAAVAQCLISYQNSHDPDDLWHMVTPDYKKASIWFQLKSGDNQEMEKVVDAVQAYFTDNPPPLPMLHQWYGLTYINVVWQDKMVTGMLEAFLGSFLIVFLMMTVLFASPLWGLLSMVPLTITIGLIYGLIGYIGKDYDMPVAVLSSLSLGLAIDFAIHFLSRSRELAKEKGSWEKAIHAIFSEPARAIMRNIIVVAVGFLPLLAAPLIPYNTVGVFIATILAVSGIGTLLILPALITVFEGKLFTQTSTKKFSCNCAVCMVSSVLVVVILAMNLREIAGMEWNTLTWMSVIAIPVLIALCGFMSRRTSCRIEETETNLEKEQ